MEKYDILCNILRLAYFKKKDIIKNDSIIKASALLGDVLQEYKFAKKNIS